MVIDEAFRHFKPFAEKFTRSEIHGPKGPIVPWYSDLAIREHQPVAIEQTAVPA